MLSMLAQGNTGTEILSILDALVADNVGGFDVIESPMSESALGVPTLEEIAFWCNLTMCPLVVRQSMSDVDTEGHLCYAWWL